MLAAMPAWFKLWSAEHAKQQQAATEQQQAAMEQFRLQQLQQQEQFRVQQQAAMGRMEQMVSHLIEKRVVERMDRSLTARRGKDGKREPIFLQEPNVHSFDPRTPLHERINALCVAAGPNAAVEQVIRAEFRSSSLLNTKFKETPLTNVDCDGFVPRQPFFSFGDGAAVGMVSLEVKAQLKDTAHVVKALHQACVLPLFLQWASARASAAKGWDTPPAKLQHDLPERMRHSLAAVRGWSTTNKDVKRMAVDMACCHRKHGHSGHGTSHAHSDGGALDVWKETLSKQAEAGGVADLQFPLPTNSDEWQARRFSMHAVVGGSTAIWERNYPLLWHGDFKDLWTAWSLATVSFKSQRITLKELAADSERSELQKAATDMMAALALVHLCQICDIGHLHIQVNE
jgi:hypothetical protein